MDNKKALRTVCGAAHDLSYGKSDAYSKGVQDAVVVAEELWLAIEGLEAELGELIDERDKLKAALGEYEDTYAQGRVDGGKDIETVVKQRDHYKAALEVASETDCAEIMVVDLRMLLHKYGEHLATCEYYRCPEVCSCGLREILGEEADGQGHESLD